MKWLKYISIGISIVIAVYILRLMCRIFLFDQFITPTESMRPTLLPGDRVIVDKTIAGARIYSDFNFETEGIELKSWRTRGRREIARNDILVFNFPHHDGKISFVINNVYAKRCVAIPGDSISIVNGYFKNNNANDDIGVLSEQRHLSNIPDSIIQHFALNTMPFDSQIPWTIKDFGPYYIPRKGDRIRITPKEAALYRMILEWETGKHIEYDWKMGTVTAEGIPLQTHEFLNDYYFMCGDNVSDSNDSRYWGPVPANYIVGVVTTISYSINPATGKLRPGRFLKNI